MVNMILSLVLGAGLDSLYYFLYISKIKDIKEKKLLLYFGIFIIYIITNMISQYNLKLYLLFDILIYLLLKFKYNAKINDFFLLIFIDFYVLLISIICFYLINNYVVALIITKVSMFIPLMFKDKLKKLYHLNYIMWDRNRENKMPIKSLTLRNICITAFNIFILINYIILLILIKK